ncbi:unnamed protein product, partial [Rotaria sp. Silwood2]
MLNEHFIGNDLEKYITIVNSIDEIIEK